MLAAEGPLTTPVRWTRFPDQWAASKADQESSLIEFAEQILETRRRSKGALPWFKMAPFGDRKDLAPNGNCYRCDANVLEVTGIEAEHDAGTMTPGEAARRVAGAGVSCLIYTSASHLHDGNGPRWRIVLPLSRACTPGERAGWVARVNGILGGALTAESFTLSQSYYYGWVKGRPKPEIHLVEGDYLDRCRLDVQPIGKPNRKAGTDGPAGRGEALDVESALEDIRSTTNYHTAIGSLAGYYASNGASAVEISDRLRAALLEVPEEDRDARWRDRMRSLPDQVRWVMAQEAKARDDVGATFEDVDDADAPPSRLDQLLARYAMVQVGNSRVVDLTSGALMTVQAFKDLNANRKAGKKLLGQAWYSHPKRLTYPGGIAFDPSGKSPEGVLNLWRGLACTPDPAADCGLILAYIRDVVADGDQAHADYILTWLADIVQNPGRKPGVALVLKGAKGVGKDTLAEIMRRIVGTHHVAHIPHADRLTNQFNAQFRTALLVHVEEAFWSGDHKAKGVLQSLITAPTMPLEGKYADTSEISSFCRLLFTTNEDWAVPATADERRYAVFEVSPIHRNDPAYFGPLYAQIEGDGPAGFLAFLLAWKAPEGVDLRQPPQTRGLADQKLAGLRNVDRWWHDVLFRGEIPAQWQDVVDGEESASWAETEQEVEKNALRDTYADWMRGRNFDGETLNLRDFGKALNRLCPEVETSRPWGTEDRRRRYRFPVLGDCREAFSQAIRIDPQNMGWSDD